MVLFVARLLIALLAAAGAIAAYVSVKKHRPGLAAGWVTIVLLPALLVLMNLSDPDQSSRMTLPRFGASEGFVTSATCMTCHEPEYETWHDSYHRTMTQVVGPDTVVADWHEQTLRGDGQITTLYRRGDEYRVRMVDPDWWTNQIQAGHDPRETADPPMTDKRVVMSTGSHHQQTFWVAGDGNGLYHNIGFVFIIEANKWVPLGDVFVRNPQGGPILASWNFNCIKCHTTVGSPGLDLQHKTLNTYAAEPGIACEACHGPGEAHVDFHRKNPDIKLDDDPTIIHPAKLDHQRSSQICGQCHNIFEPRDDRHWYQFGDPYRPGDDLNEKRHVLNAAELNHDAYMRKRVREEPTLLTNKFWPDGIVRVSGRDYLGMIESPCYKQGDLSCLSCHSMHDSDPVDQLKTEMQSDEACLQCHEVFRASDALVKHTHHPAASSGSRCYNCHMPHTTYGLLKAIRSHTIDSPDLAKSLASGRPNACNLCHLDQTLAWTQAHLQDWYGQETVALSDTQQHTAAGVLWALTGDAGIRALIAWHMGWSAAKQASGTDWPALYLADALTDPYSAVRYIAQRSLRSLPGYASLDYDYIAPAEQRQTVAQRIILDWQPHATSETDRTRLLLDGQGHWQRPRVNQLLLLRDDRPMDLQE